MPGFSNSTLFPPFQTRKSCWCTYNAIQIWK